VGKAAGLISNAIAGALTPEGARPARDLDFRRPPQRGGGPARKAA
jgi:hypothetical protein